MWFRSEDRLVSEEYTFKIDTKEELTPIYSLIWIYGSIDAQIIYQTHNYCDCVKRLDLIQEELGCYNERLIDLTAEGVEAHFDKKNRQEIVEEVDTNPISTITDDEIMDYLNNNDKYMTYESYLENKRKNDVEKFIDKTPIISTPKELAEKLHEYRRANGWNVLGTAKALGIVPSTVWGWFNGTNIPRFKNHRDLLAKTLNVRFEKDM